MAIDERRKRSSIESLATAALYHRDAAIHLFEKFNAQRPEVSGAFFPVFMEVVAFELLLLSVEQSLKVLLLLHDPNYLPKENHDIHKLLIMVEEKSNTKKVNASHRNLFKKLLVKINKERIDYAKVHKISAGKPITKDELKDTFKAHADSYTNYRYFGVTKDLSQRPINLENRMEAILHAAALILAKINLAKMEQEGLSPHQYKPVTVNRSGGVFSISTE